jgi:SAM-dependent methyltransferase
MMRLIPPGQWCLLRAVADRLDRSARSFVDVGCGSGVLAHELCRRGLRGVGVDASLRALAVARAELGDAVAARNYRLVLGPIESLAFALAPADATISLMTLEHVADEEGFVRSLARVTRPGGQVIVSVPGRWDRWGFEDEVVGHLRRYERDSLTAVMRRAGLVDVEVWSVAVPIANLLYHVGNRLTRRATAIEVRGQSKREQTLTSGIREIPWKTTFPPWCRALLNPLALAPAFAAQRLFYGTSLGLTLLAAGRTTVGGKSGECIAQPAVRR